MKNSLDSFIDNKKNSEFFAYLKNYKPKVFFIFLDSEVARKGISRKYSARIPFFSGSIEKRGLSIFCRLDSDEQEYTVEELLNKYNKSLIITGIGLYGEIFIKFN